MIHNLKTDGEAYDAIVRREKLFEVRRADRMYGVGDILRLLRLNEQGEVDGSRMDVTVTYLLGGEDAERYGLRPGFVVMSLGRLT